jgi:hypothetical protein
MSPSEVIAWGKVKLVKNILSQLKKLDTYEPTEPNMKFSKRLLDELLWIDPVAAYHRIREKLGRTDVPLSDEEILENIGELRKSGRLEAFDIKDKVAAKFLKLLVNNQGELDKASPASRAAWEARMFTYLEAESLMELIEEKHKPRMKKTIDNLTIGNFLAASDVLLHSDELYPDIRCYLVENAHDFMDIGTASLGTRLNGLTKRFVKHKLQSKRRQYNKVLKCPHAVGSYVGMMSDEEYKQEES